MNNGMDEFFKQQAKLHRLMSQVSTSPTSRIAAEMNKLIMMTDITKSPLITMINEQNSLVNQISSISKWNSDIYRLVNSQSFKMTDVIPESLYDSLDELFYLVDPNSHYQTSQSDLAAEITVPEKEIVHENKLTWADYFQMLLMLITLAYGIYDSNATSQQFEELIGEIQMQNEISEHNNSLQEQNNELLEKNTEIQEQILYELKSQNITEEKKLEIHHAIEVKVDEIIESIDSFTDTPIDANAE